jgi:hypothetical protein
MNDNPFDPPEKPEIQTRQRKRVRQPFPYQKYSPWQWLLLALCVWYVVYSYVKLLLRW